MLCWRGGCRVTWKKNSKTEARDKDDPSEVELQRELALFLHRSLPLSLHLLPWSVWMTQLNFISPQRRQVGAEP